MSDWTKVNREKTESTKVDRTDYGWFISGWFRNWFGEVWKKVNREKEDWNKVNKE